MQRDTEQSKACRKISIFLIPLHIYKHTFVCVYM